MYMLQHVIGFLLIYLLKKIATDASEQIITIVVKNTVTGITNIVIDTATNVTKNTVNAIMCKNKQQNNTNIEIDELMKEFEQI